MTPASSRFSLDFVERHPIVTLRRNLTDLERSHTMQITRRNYPDERDLGFKVDNPSKTPKTLHRDVLDGRTLDGCATRTTETKGYT